MTDGDETYGANLKGIDLETLRHDYSEYSACRAALRVLLLACAASSGLQIRVDDEPVPVSQWPSLIAWDSEEEEEIPIGFDENQSERTPHLVAELDRSEIELFRTEDSVCFEPLLEYLHPRVPSIRSMAHELMQERTKFMRKYPRVVQEEPSLLAF